jgi:hypothetical protein
MEEELNLDEEDYKLDKSCYFSPFGCFTFTKESSFRKILD